MKGGREGRRREGGGKKCVSMSISFWTQHEKEEKKREESGEGEVGRVCVSPQACLLNPP